MQKLIYSVATLLFPYLFYLIFDKNQIGKADKIVSIIECAAFAITFFVHAYGLIALIKKKKKKAGFKTLFPLARRFIIIGMILHLCFGVLTVSWLLTVQWTGSFDFGLDLLYGILELFLCCYSWFGVQFVMNATVRKSVFPGVGDPNCTLFGDYLIKYGVSPDLIARAAAAQQEELDKLAKN